MILMTEIIYKMNAPVCQDDPSFSQRMCVCVRAVNILLV